jgi:hypothetical protein
MKFNAKTQRRKDPAWLTPLWKLNSHSKSGVAAALCHRSPKSSRRTMISRDCGAKKSEKLASSGLCGFAFIF